MISSQLQFYLMKDENEKYTQINRMPAVDMNYENRFALPEEEVEESMIQMIDSRKQVDDILSYPCNKVGYIRIDFYKLGDSKKERIGCIHGSGVLIAPHLVLTCAHNLFAPDKKYVINSDRMKFYLAYNQYVGYQYNIKGFDFPELYLTEKEEWNQKSRKNDFAILYLEEKNYPLEGSQLIGIWDEEAFKQIVKNEKQLKIQTYGYPNDKNKEKLRNINKRITNENLVGYQFRSKGSWLKTDENYLWHNMYAQEGQSGSPIFIQDQNKLKLIGIHKGEHLSQEKSYGIPLWKMKNQINGWFVKKYQRKFVEDD